MALITLTEYAEAHGLKITNVRTARQRGKLLTAVKRHGVWMVDESEPWWRERCTDKAKEAGDAGPAAVDRVLMIRRHARCGEDEAIFDRCLGAVPAEVREALPARQVAALVDAIHDSYEHGYRAGRHDADQEALSHDTPICVRINSVS